MSRLCVSSASPRRVAGFVSLLGAHLLAQGGVVWTQRVSAVPPPRYGHSMVYDLLRQRLVMFGGRQVANGVLLSAMSDTWEWSWLTNWQRANPAPGPSARMGHAMAYDTRRSRVVLFGGYEHPANSLRADTWEWSGTGWSQVALAVSPPARTLHAMTYDAAGHCTVLFGGLGQAGTSLGDTWKWNAFTNYWLQVPNPGPSARSGHAMTYDEARDCVVVFGGVGNGNTHTDTWERHWLNQNWTQANPALSPPALSSVHMAYDRGRQRVVLFGSLGPLSTASETWEWDGGDWVPRTASQSPSPRNSPAMAYAANEQRMVVFGGLAAIQGAYWTVADHWELSSISPPLVSATPQNSCPGSVGPLGLDPAPFSMPWAGDTFLVELGNLPAGCLPFLVIGFSNTTWSGGALPRDLSVLGLNNCWQYVSMDIVRMLALTGSTVTSSISIPAIPGFVGTRIYLQGAALSAGAANTLGAAISNGLTVRIGMR